MKNRPTLFLAYILPISIVFVVWTFGNIFWADQVFMSQINGYLIGISSSKRDRVGEIISEKKNDVEFISGSGEVKSILSKENFPSTDVAAREGRNTADIIAKEVENFVKYHPEMTLDELLSNEEFLNIAVKKIDERGFSVIFRSDNFDANLHGLEQGEFSEVEKESLFDITSQLDIDPSKNYVETFSASDENEEFASKYYGYFRRTEAITSNQVSLGVGVIAYADDYRIIDNASVSSEREYLELFAKKANCNNIFLLSQNGNIVFMDRNDDDLGVDISRVEEKEMYDGYRRAIESGNVAVTDPFSRDSKEDLFISLASPVYDGERLLGTVIVLYDFEDIIDIVSDVSELGETGDSYLANTKGLLVSPLRFRQSDLLVQNIKTKNFFECSANGKNITDVKVVEFNNYLGNETLGTGLMVPGVDWCLMTEVGADEMFRKSRMERIISEVITAIFGIIIIMIFHIIIKKYFSNK